MSFSRTIAYNIRFIYHILTIKIIYPLFYIFLIHTSKKKINTKKIIIDNKGLKKIDDSFSYLVQYLTTETDYEIVIYNKRSRFTGDFQILREIANSHFIFLSTFHYLIDNIKLRPETKVINLWHGCGIFKKFGYSSLNTKWGAKHADTFNLYKNTTLFTTSSPFCVPYYREAINHLNDATVQPLGISRTDVFFNKTYIENADYEINELIPNLNNRKIILYAPTFRGDSLEQSTYPDFLNFKLLEQFKNKYILLIKHHPAIKSFQEIDTRFSDFVINVTGKIEINKLLCKADILISDYSSLIFEYSLFERPMIFFGPDIDNYNQDRGFFINYFDMIPGILCRTNEELINCIDKIDSFDYKKIKEFKEKFMSSCDGHSTERILNYIEQL